MNTPDTNPTVYGVCNGIGGNQTECARFDLPIPHPPGTQGTCVESRCHVRGCSRNIEVDSSFGAHTGTGSFITPVVSVHPTEK